MLECLDKLIDSLDPEVNKEELKIVLKNQIDYFQKENKMKEKEYDGTIYKKEIGDEVSVVDSVVINKKKKKDDPDQLDLNKNRRPKKNPQILENVPEEFRDGDKKILLEG